MIYANRTKKSTETTSVLTSKSSVLNMFHSDTSFWVGQDWGNESSNASRAKGQVGIDNSNVSEHNIP